MTGRNLELPTKDMLAMATPTGLKVCIRILGTWSCSHLQMATILGMSKDLLNRYIHNPESVSLSREQQMRLSYILNIYECIQIIFNNQTNIDNFMSLQNHNKPFNGRKPIDLLTDGNIENFKDIYYYLESFCSGRYQE